MKHTVVVDTDLPTEFRDEGPWRSYRVYAEGTTLTELLQSAGIEEVDQDGGTLDWYDLAKAPSDVEEDASLAIAQAFMQANRDASLDPFHSLQD